MQMAIYQISEEYKRASRKERERYRKDLFKKERKAKTLMNNVNSILENERTIRKDYASIINARTNAINFWTETESCIW